MWRVTNSLVRPSLAVKTKLTSFFLNLTESGGKTSRLMVVGWYGGGHVVLPVPLVWHGKFSVTIPHRPSEAFWQFTPFSEQFSDTLHPSPSSFLTPPPIPHVAAVPLQISIDCVIHVFMCLGYNLWCISPTRQVKTQ